MGSSFDVNVVDGDDIIGAKFFGIIGDSQRCSYQHSKNMLLQRIISKIAKVVPNSNVPIRQACVGPFG
jgi:hypothetical protein